MWDIDRYVNLLMGEIPRLKDDENGYGPKGKNFIAHVDIPETVYDAFKQLKAVYGDITREAKLSTHQNNIHRWGQTTPRGRGRSSMYSNDMQVGKNDLWGEE